MNQHKSEVFPLLIENERDMEISRLGTISTQIGCFFEFEGTILVIIHRE